MAQNPTPLTGVETMIEQVIDYVQAATNDPVFMADLETFLKLAGDFLESQIGEQSGASAQAQPYPGYVAPKPTAYASAEPTAPISAYDARVKRLLARQTPPVPKA